MEMTDERLAEIIEQTVKRCYSEHKCLLTDEEIGLVKSTREALVEEGGNHGTIRVLVQWGVNLTDITKQVRRAIILVIAVIVLAFSVKMIFR